MSAPHLINGRPPRKQLCEQLDRLDSIIDSLADGLPAAVAEAAREGTRAAVKDAIVEILTNPELRTLIQSFTPAAPATVSVPMTAAAETAPAMPTAWQRLKARLAAAKDAVSSRYTAARNAVTNTTRALSLMLPLRRIALVAVGAGVVVAALGYVAPAGVAAALAGVGGCVTAAAAQVGNCFRRPTRRLNTT
ncbi:MAG TPA: hypothetical protein VGI99_00250 [Gemmataceae bacterium]|jgi:hypothetical protein